MLGRSFGTPLHGGGTSAFNVLLLSPVAVASPSAAAFPKEVSLLSFTVALSKAALLPFVVAFRDAVLLPEDAVTFTNEAAMSASVVESRAPLARLPRLQMTPQTFDTLIFVFSAARLLKGGREKEEEKKEATKGAHGLATMRVVCCVRGR